MADPGSSGTHRAPARGSEPKLDRLRALLREMFQLDRGDLDFGLYRIMGLMAAEVSAFLDDDLLPQIQEQLSLTTAGERARLEKELEMAGKQARAAGYDPDANPSDDIVDLAHRLAEMKKDAEAEADIYNHLANFFARYYTEGDFMSLRRYSSGGRSSYLIPYDGEEVKLHWANSDQYYIKTTENYASYIFTVGSGDAAKRVCFEIAAADNEKDNVKEAAGKYRRFVLTKGRNAIAVEDGQLVARFDHRPLTDGEKKKWPGTGAKQQGGINKTSVERILNAADADWGPLLAAPAPTDADSERTLLAKHVERYTAKNSFDYFIHKDLGGFLRRELDMYLNTEVMNLDDLAAGDTLRLDRALARVRVVRHIGRKIIDFLAQLEGFQKQLWLKKKFVLETQWCVTLDRVPEALYPEISANAEQCEEWVRLFAADEIKGDLASTNAAWSNPPSVDFLKANSYLVLDTRHFERDFTDRLLAALSDAGPLEEQLDGLLIHGENFQALNLLQARYNRQVPCVYIDPPYNTGDSEIHYKNGYLNSSWLTLMASRLAVLGPILERDTVLYIAIDDFEMANLAELIDTHCPSLRRDMIVVNHHPQGGKAKTLAQTHEYMIVCTHVSSTRTLAGRKRDDEDEVELRPFKRSGTAESNFRYGRPNSFYAILVHPDSRQVVGLEPPPVDDEYPRGRTDDGLLRIYPIGNQGQERVWRRSHQSCGNLIRNGKLRCTDGNTIYQVIESGERKAALFSNWTDSRYNAGTYGANLLRDILGEQNLFSYPKSLFTVEDAIFAVGLNVGEHVLDFFAGSGTTGHAVIDLNRQDGGQRKFILVEMGGYFHSVLVPRIKKVVYSSEWKEGKPVKRDGTSQLLKCVQIESYEDTLDSLDVATKTDDQMQLLNDNPEMAEDYRLRYALGVETARSASLLGKELRDPFAYSVSVVRDGVRRQVLVDLPETFNYLIGLRVESRHRIESVLAIAGKDAEGQNCLIIWRRLDEMDHAALDAWFDRHRQQFSDSLNLIYVNGDHTLNAMQRHDDAWTAITIEPLFRELMFRGT